MKKEIIDSTDDTNFSETTEEYLRKVTDFGFEVIYEEDFKSDNVDEKFYILWHKKYSILLCFDTFRGSRNSGNYYYNWSPNTREDSSLTSSGGWRSLYMDLETMTEKPNPEKEPEYNSPWKEYKIILSEWSERNQKYLEENNLRRIWSGHHDCREGIKNQINLMVENGFFINKWIEQPFIWLSHHGDNNPRVNNFNYKPLIIERYEKLPNYVKECINKNKFK